MPISFNNLDALIKALADMKIVDDPAALAADIINAVGLEDWSQRPYRSKRAKKVETVAAQPANDVPALSSAKAPKAIKITVEPT